MPTRKALKADASMAALGLPDFETEVDCRRRQLEMLRRLEHCNGPNHECKAFASCDSDYLICVGRPSAWLQGPSHPPS
jgi:hypothetical protein